MQAVEGKKPRPYPRAGECFSLYRGFIDHTGPQVFPAEMESLGEDDVAISVQQLVADLRMDSSGYTYQEVADAMGIAVSTVVRALKTYGGGRSKTLAWRIRSPESEHKRNEVVTLYAKGLGSTSIARVVGYSEAHVRKIVSTAGISRPLGSPESIRPKRPINFAYKPKVGGYILARFGRARVWEHRMIASKMLGRSLRRDEVVHHKNGKRHDNRPENLEVLTVSEHRKMHKSDLRCLLCNEPAEIRFLCKVHYNAARRNGELDKYPAMRKPYVAPNL